MSNDNSLMPFFPLDVNEGISKSRPKKCNASIDKAPIFQVEVHVKPTGFSVNLNFGWRTRQTVELLFRDE